jgi:hypothetical protein
MPEIHIPRAYRKYTKNKALHKSKELDLHAIFIELLSIYPLLVGTVFSIDVKPFPFVRIVVQDALVDIEDYAVTKISVDTKVMLVNAVAGG